MSEPLPPKLIGGQWSSAGRVYRGAWRSTAAWVCVLALLVHGVVLPAAPLFGLPGGEIDWLPFITLMGGLGVLTHYRSNDLSKGVTT